MKKWILSAVFIMALCGYAAAQMAPAPEEKPSKSQKKVKKPREKSRQAKRPAADSATREITIVLPPFAVDTINTVPRARKQD